MAKTPAPPKTRTSKQQAAPTDNISLHTLWAPSDVAVQVSPTFDAVLRMVQSRFRVKTAVIFVAEQGQVALHMRVGADPNELNCNAALAACIGQPNRTLVLEEVAGDGESRAVRFYAGAPLVTSAGGPAVGMLCLMDTKARSFSSADELLLRSLAIAVSTTLLMPHEPVTAQAVALMAQKSMLLLDDSQSVEAVNARFTQLTSFAVDDLLGTGVDDLLCLDRPNSGAMLISHALLAEVPVHGMTRCHTHGGGTLPVEVFVFPLSDPRGRVVKTLLLIAPLFSGPVEDFLLSLRSSERNALLTLHIAGLWSVNTTGLIVKLSGAPVAHLDASNQENICGRRLDSSGVFDAAQTDFSSFYQSIAEHSLPDEVECCVTHNGASHWYSMVGFVQSDARGKAIGYHGSFRDITRRKLKEQALRKSEERQRLILQGTNDGAWDWDLETKDYYLSPKWWEITGREPEEQLPAREMWSRFVHPDDLASANAVLKDAMAGGQDKYQDEYRMLHRDGDYFPVLCRGHFLRNEQGRVIRASGTIQDLRPQRQAQAQIRLLQSCVESLQDAVLITHASPRKKPGPFIAYVNPAFERFTGYTSAEAIGQTPRMLQGPLTCRMELDKIIAAMSKWQSVRCELANYKKNGEVFWVELDIVPVKTEGNDSFTHWIGVQRDITQRRQSEQALRLTSQRLTMALEASGLGLWASYKATGENFCDAGWHAMLGLPPNDLPLPPDRWHRWVHPEDLAQVNGEGGAATAAGDAPFEKTFRMRHAAGHWIWVKSRGKVIERDAAGQPLVLAGTHTDISAEVRARQQTERNNAQLSRCLEHLSVGVILQGQGIIKFVNSTLLQIFGSTQASDVVGTRFSEYILPGDIPAAKWRQQQLMAGATLPAFWFNCVHTNGQIFKALTSSTVIEWDGEPHILSCMTPPSDSAMLLQEVESVKTRYASLLARQLEAQQINIAHELHDSLGSQLACISLQAASVGEVSSDSHAQRVELARLQESTRTAAEMTRNLARGLMPVDDFPGSFWRALERLCNDFNNAPALRCRFEMVGDFDAINVEVGTHLYRIAQEAITNALRHGHATHVVVRLELAGQDRILSITDNGSGFDPTTVQHTPGVGLGSIYARAGAIGAQVALAKQTPCGFCVEVRYTDASITADL